VQRTFGIENNDSNYTVVSLEPGTRSGDALVYIFGPALFTGTEPITLEMNCNHELD
jgi:hypothetical protein